MQETENRWKTPTIFMIIPGKRAGGGQEAVNFMGNVVLIFETTNNTWSGILQRLPPMVAEVTVILPP